MPGQNDIIKDLIKTIDGSVNTFNSSIPKVQRDILAEVELLVKKLDLKADSLQRSAKNLRIIGELNNKINRILRSPEYTGLVKEFAKSFGEISKLQNEYFRSIEKQFKPPKLLGELQAQSTDAALRSLIQGGVEVNIGSKIVDILRQNITGGAKYTDMVERLREYLTTTKAGDGALERYAKQITTDALNQYSAQYLNVVSNDLGLEWFRYTGSEIETSRPFCKACLDKQFIHVSEIPDLLTGNFPEFKKEDGKINPKTKLPEGMVAGTNVENFHVYRGGWNCGHQLVPVSEDRVPQVIKDKVGLNISSKKKVDYDLLKSEKGFDKSINAMMAEFKERKIDTRTILSKFDKEELASLWQYTGEKYGDLNNQMRNNNLTDYNRVLKNTLDRALSKLPNHSKGEYYRGAPLSQAKIDQYRHHFEEKTPITEAGFTSSSINSATAWTFANMNKKAGDTPVVFTVIGKNGKYVDNLSDHQGEAEILFGSKVKFKVTAFAADKIAGRDVYKITLKEY